MFGDANRVKEAKGARRRMGGGERLNFPASRTFDKNFPSICKNKNLICNYLLQAYEWGMFFQIVSLKSPSLRF